MKLVALLLLLPLCAFGQATPTASRYDNYVQTTAKNVPYGAQAPVYSIPNSSISVWADAGCTTTPVKVYFDQAMVNSIQQPITTDNQGKFGFWVPAGTYYNLVTNPAGVVIGCQPITIGSFNSGASAGAANQVQVAAAGGTFAAAPITADSVGNLLVPKGITAVSGCPVQSAMVICLTSPPYSAVAGQDVSVALQAAINALAITGGKIYIPPGVFYLNGPLQDTSGANAIVTLPSVTAYGSLLPPMIEIIGSAVPSGQSANYGTILQTSATSGSVIGGYNSGGTFPGFTNYWLNVENLTFRAPSLPNITMVNAKHLMALHATHVWCDTGTNSPSTPNSGNGTCISFPTVANNVSNLGDDLTSVGFGTSFVLTEHTKIGSIYAANAYIGLSMDNGILVGPGAGSYQGNTISIQNAWIAFSHYAVTAGLSASTITIESLDTELVDRMAVYDPTNLLTGHINVNNPYPPFYVPLTGANNLKVDTLRPTVVEREPTIGEQDHISYSAPGVQLTKTGCTSSSCYSASIVGPYTGGTYAFPSTWVDPQNRGGLFQSNGFTFRSDDASATMRLGTTNSNPFEIYTNNTLRLGIDASGYMTVLNLAGKGCVVLAVNNNGTIVPTTTTATCP